MRPEPVSLEEANTSRELGKQPQTYLRGGGTILFQETFANGFDGINGNGAWTVNDNGGDSLWVWVQPGGQGLYANGDATGVTHPAGEFSTNIGTLQSTTGDDGFMIFDCDYYNTPIASGYQDTEGSLTSPVLNFEAIGSVIVNW